MPEPPGVAALLVPMPMARAPRRADVRASTLLFRHPSRTVQRRALGVFLKESAARIYGRQAVTCLITTDAAMKALNRQFLGKDYTTDVLSFPGDGAGEIAISLDRARAQAREFGHHLELELRILILHGLLHLKGMDHERDQGEMARAETRWRKRLGLPTGLIERSKA